MIHIRQVATWVPRWAAWCATQMSKCGVCFETWVVVVLQGVAARCLWPCGGRWWRLRLCRSERLVATKKYFVLSGVYAGLYNYVHFGADNDGVRHCCNRADVFFLGACNPGSSAHKNVWNHALPHGTIEDVDHGMISLSKHWNENKQQFERGANWTLLLCRCLFGGGRNGHPIVFVPKKTYNHMRIVFGHWLCQGQFDSKNPPDSAIQIPLCKKNGCLEQCAAPWTNWQL